MSEATMVLTGAALAIGVVHTLIGPDHYLPFVMMARAQKWALPKTLAVTVVCGLGHVLSSVVLGVVGIAAGVALNRLEAFEGSRGALAAWALIAFEI